MDFNDTPEEAQFRAEVRAWLEKNAKPKSGRPKTARGGMEDDFQLLEQAKAWQAKKADAGYVSMHWPKKYGGQDAPPMKTVIYSEEEARYDVPRGFFDIGLGMCGPTLLTSGTEEQKQRYLPKMIRGEEVWSQLFSEPAAGSDLAGLISKADRNGDEWIVNGQKVWTSGAHYSDWGILVTRHDPTMPKHKGLTFFVVDMKSPGIEIRPIKQISGHSHFCEVFFNDVRIPDANRVGDVGQGWQVSITTLMHERLVSGGALPPDFDEIFELAQKVELADGPAIRNAAVRDKLANWYIQTQGLRHIRSRTLTALSRGETPGPENSIYKVVAASKRQEIASFGADLLDMGGSMTEEELAPFEALFQEAYLSSPGLRIAAGTDEILRNIIAERVLGLPQDIRVDKDKPFNEVPRGTA